MAGQDFAKLAIVIEARLANLEQGLADATKKTEAAAGQMSAALEKISEAGKRVAEALGEYLSIRAFAELIKSSIEAQDHLIQLAARTQLTVEQVGGLGFASKQTGVSLDEMAVAVGRFNISIGKAAAGDKDLSHVFESVGVSIKNLDGSARDGGAVIADLADKFKSYADGPEKSALGHALFQRSFQTLLPLLQKGGDFLRENIAFYNQYSGVTTDSTKAAEEFNEVIARLQLLMSTFGTNLTNAVLSPLRSFAERLVEIKTESAASSSVITSVLAKAIEGLLFTLSGVIERVLTVVDALRLLKNSASSIGSSLSEVFNTRLSQMANGPIPFLMDTFRKSKDEVGGEIDKFLDEQDKRSKRLRESFRNLIGSPTGAGRSPEGDNLVAQVTRAPNVPVNNSKGGPKPVVDDPAAKQLAATLAMLDDGIKQEQELLTERNKLLDLFNSRGLVSIKDYYDQRANIIEEATAKEQADIIAQVAVLEQRRDQSLRNTDPRVKGQEQAAELQKQIDAKLRQIDELDKKAGVQATEDAVKRVFAQQDFQKSLDETAAKVFELQGNLVAAAAINFNQTTKSLRELFTAAGGEKGARGNKALDELEAHAIAMAQISEVTKESARNDEALQNAEERLTLAQNAGAKGELETLAATGRLRAERVQQLELEVKAQEAIARANPKDKDAIATADRARLALDKLKATVDPLADRINGVFENSLSNAFSGFISGSRNAAQAFGDFAKSVINDLLKIASQEIAKSIFGGSGGFGGLLSRWFSGGSGLGAGLGAADGATFTGVGFGDLISRAAGGSVQPYGMARVNEHGPETLTVDGKDYLMMGNRSGLVTPAGAQAQSGPSITVNIASGVSRNELAALIPSLKTQIKAELIASQRRPGYAGT